MPKIKKTVLIFEVDDKMYDVQYTGSFKLSDDKNVRKHDERLIDLLVQDERVFDFLNRLITPVIRYKQREAKRARKKPSTRV